MRLQRRSLIATISKRAQHNSPNQKPFTISNWEWKKRNYLFSWGVTGFYMKYKDQLVLTGKVNDVGAYTRTNIPNSYRVGVELQGKWRPLDWFNAAGNLTWSENKVKDFVEYVDDYDNGGQKTKGL
jgi:iron complex outermembrane receptor protein